MERNKMKAWLDKYKYAMLILALGLALMLVPQSKTEESQVSHPAEAPSLSQQLQSILSRIEGAGSVEVLLTEAKGSRVFYQTDIKKDADGQRENMEEKTVIVSGSDRAESGLVLGTDPPTYQGAVVVCQGADRAEVKLAIVEAVRCATGLGANQISVVKMK